MRRRAFITVLGGAAAAWPLAVRGQQPAKMPTIGFLGSNTHATQSKWTAAFTERLHELGWIEGRTIAIEFRWAGGRSERGAEIAAEFVRLKVDVIVTSGTAFVAATKRATSLIPIVFAVVADPLGSGLVKSLARPDGNVTGLSLQYTDLASKRLELLREIVPGLRQLAILANVKSPGAQLEMRAAQVIAESLSLKITALEIRQGEDIAPGVGSLKDRTDALYVCSDPLVATYRAQISALALNARLPTVHGLREHVEVGGLMSYGASFPAMFRRAAELVDKILRGAKPADIPVEQPTKFDFVINLKTAKALGLEVPPMLLVRADEVIE
jgi:putative ABC transport system substrate-binding protein